MKFTNALLALTLAAGPVFAAPVVPDDGISISGHVVVDTPLEARDTTVTCSPKNNKSPTKSFKVSVDNAQAQIKVAGLQEGKSGDPHKYENKDKIEWGNNNCDSKKNTLLEYPVYWQGANQKEWSKGEKSDKQEKTPIRVVYANVNGAPVYCGIMTHSEVDKNYQGKDFFEKCQ